MPQASNLHRRRGFDRHRKRIRSPQKAEQEMREAVIASTARTPIGRASRGAFNDTEGQELAVHAIWHACAARDSRGGEMADVIVGCVLPQGSTGGTVSSLEVEYGLVAAPGNADAAVLGVPDDVMGEKVGAAVVGADDGAVEVVAFVGHCRTHLADFKVPQLAHATKASWPLIVVGPILLAENVSGQIRLKPPAMAEIYPSGLTLGLEESPFLPVKVII